MSDSLWPHTLHGILQAGILEWVAAPFSRESSQPRDWTQVSHIAGRFFYQLSHQSRPKLGNEYVKTVYCHPAYLNYSEYIIWNAGLDESLAGIKTAKRNISNLRYADDTTLMAESEEKQKSLLMKVKVESEKVGLKLNIQ